MFLLHDHDEVPYDIYYIVNTHGDIQEEHDTNHIVDIKRFKSGNYFYTIQQAKESDIYKSYHRVDLDKENLKKEILANRREFKRVNKDCIFIAKHIKN
ncbi:MAG: hypothetical protein ACRC5T_05185 [Cetobacterium sp.]